MEFLPSDEVTAIRSRLDHPIIDADGHAIEYLPLVRDILREQAGDDAVAVMDLVTGGASASRGLTPEQMRGAGLTRTSWWGRGYAPASRCWSTTRARSGPTG